LRAASDNDKSASMTPRVRRLYSSPVTPRTKSQGCSRFRALPPALVHCARPTLDHLPMGNPNFLFAGAGVSRRLKDLFQLSNAKCVAGRSRALCQLPESKGAPAESVCESTLRNDEADDRRGHRKRPCGRGPSVVSPIDCPNNQIGSCLETSRRGGSASILRYRFGRLADPKQGAGTIRCVPF